MGYPFDKRPKVYSVYRVTGRNGRDTVRAFRKYEWRGVSGLPRKLKTKWLGNVLAVNPTQAVLAIVEALKAEKSIQF